MKKWTYIVSGFALGVVVALSGSTAFASVQSLIGKKVTGEMVVVVDGKQLQNKGAVIDGVTNVPARSLTEALGVGLSLEGKTIYINSQNSPQSSTEREKLLHQKEKLENSIKSIQQEIQKTKDKMEQAKIPGTDRYEAEETWKAAINDLETNLSKKQSELDNVNEALKTYE